MQNFIMIGQCNKHYAGEGRQIGPIVLRSAKSLVLIGLRKELREYIN